MEVNSIYSSKMFPLTRHMRSAGLNVYNSAQLSDKIANIISLHFQMYYLPLQQVPEKK